MKMCYCALPALMGGNPCKNCPNNSEDGETKTNSEEWVIIQSSDKTDNFFWRA